MKDDQVHTLQLLMEPKDRNGLYQVLLSLLDVQSKGEVGLYPDVIEWLKRYNTSDKGLIPAIGILLYHQRKAEGRNWKDSLEEIKIEDIWDSESIEPALSKKLNAMPLAELSRVFWGLFDPEMPLIYRRSHEIFSDVNLLHFKETVLYYKHLVLDTNLLDYHYLNLISLISDKEVE